MTSSDQSGYTLIELLVIATIGVLITVAAINLFFSVILAGGKSSALNDVRHNGDYAITQIERTVRSADSINACGTLDSPSADIDLDINGNSIIIGTDSGTNQIMIDSNPVTSSGLSDLYVTATTEFVCYYSNGSAPPIVDYTFTIQKGDPNKDRQSDIVEETFHGRAQLRSY